MADWEEAIKEAYASAPSEQVIYRTVELNHSTFGLPVRLISDYGEYQYTDEESGVDIYGRYLTLETELIHPKIPVFFQAVSFSIDLPTQSDARISGLELTIDNATSIIAHYLDKAVTERDPMTAVYREFLSTDTTKPNLVIKNLTIPKVSTDAFRARATAEFKDLVNKKFPNKTYDPDEYRGLAT